QGADDVFDHTSADYQKQIMAKTDGKGVDLVIEMLANVNLVRDLEMLAMRGRVVIVGNRGAIEINPRSIMSKDAVVTGFTNWNATPNELVTAHAAGVAGGALAAGEMEGSRRNAAETAAMDNLLQQVDRTSQSLNARLDAVSGEMNRTFAHALQQATQSLTGSIGTVREETRAAIQEKFVQVTDRLGDLKATNERIMEFSRSLDEFQRMLQSPKLRGDFGEFTLEQMLRDLLPAEHWEAQAPIGSARVDALIRTPHGALCIDCKFPLDNFRRAPDAGQPLVRDAE